MLFMKLDSNDELLYNKKYHLFIYSFTNIVKMNVLRENAENLFSGNVRNVKPISTDPLKMIKQAVRPLSDVKNILTEKNVGPLRKAAGGGVSEARAKPAEPPLDYGEELCFYEEYVDDYRDIWPASLQLTKEDFKGLCSMMDASNTSPLRSPSPLSLPMVGFHIIEEDQAEFSDLTQHQIKLAEDDDFEFLEHVPFDESMDSDVSLELHEKF